MDDLTDQKSVLGPVSEQLVAITCKQASIRMVMNGVFKNHTHFLAAKDDSGSSLINTRGQPYLA